MQITISNVFISLLPSYSQDVLENVSVKKGKVPKLYQNFSYANLLA